MARPTNKIPVTRFSCGAVVVLALVAMATPASALGCLTEFDDCGRCAEEMLFDAIRDLSPGDAIRAYVYGIDCEIDLIHCMLYADHHTYSCGA